MSIWVYREKIENLKLTLDAAAALAAAFRSLVMGGGCRRVRCLGFTGVWAIMALRCHNGTLLDSIGSFTCMILSMAIR